MTSDLDIFRYAQLIVDQHSDEAPIFAAMQADKMLERGDMEGRAAWHRILAAVRELLTCQRSASSTAHACLVWWMSAKIGSVEVVIGISQFGPLGVCDRHDM